MACLLAGWDGAAETVCRAAILYARHAPVARAADPFAFHPQPGVPQQDMDRAVPVGPQDRGARAPVALEHLRARMAKAVAIPCSNDRPARGDSRDELGARGAAAAVMRRKYDLGLDVRMRKERSLGL